MAVTKSMLSLNISRYFLCPFSSHSKFRLFSSASTSDLAADIDVGGEGEGEGENKGPIYSTEVLSEEEAQIAENIHSLIKDHHRKNPTASPTSVPLNPSISFPTLSFDFSRIFDNRSISPPVVLRVIEKCGAVRHGIPFSQALAFFNWAAARDARGSFLNPEPYNEMIDLAGKAGRDEV